MEPALDVINRSLHGDTGARSFLERTTSLYMLDATNPANPKTYGCWNFIHQGMNEVERYEAAYKSTPAGSTNSNNANLVSHVRLLSSMAMRVARRSPSADNGLVSTCIANASEYNVTSTQSQWLVNVNLELREIVMGRIAAMAFDHNFHGRNYNSHPNGNNSAFADRVVMDSFCAILSANAISSGPQAVRHFATEWIIPSSRNLPPFAVASVVLHLAVEGTRKVAPAGTKDILQQLSVPVMAHVLVQTLVEAISDNSDRVSDTASLHEETSHVASMCLKAMKAWCDTTDLSLPQLKHICSKVNLDIVAVTSDAMYSDVPQVIEALAEFVESTVSFSDEKVLSEGRMNQVRHIIQVDAATFRARFSADQLKTIEAKEMETIVLDFVSAVGLQRFRYTERQTNGEHDVCRNLIRIGASVVGTCLDILQGNGGILSEPGAVELLLKGAGHPAVGISGLALAVLNRLVSCSPTLAGDLLPILQRRAIAPHTTAEGTISLVYEGSAGTNFAEFVSFRETILSDALIECWDQARIPYMDSCTSAIEEFCSASPPGSNKSMQLEAALFCTQAVAEDSLALDDESFPHADQLQRIMIALRGTPAIILSNPLTLARMCSFFSKYSQWIIAAGKLGDVFDLLNSVFSKFLDHRYVESSPLLAQLAEYNVSPFSEACASMKQFLDLSPEYFANDVAFLKLIDLWEATFNTSDRGEDLLPLDDRLALCKGMTHVVATLEGDKKIDRFQRLSDFSLSRIERFVDTEVDLSEEQEILTRYSSLVSILATTFQCFTTDRGGFGVHSMDHGPTTSPDVNRSIPQAALSAMIKRTWTTMLRWTKAYGKEENVSKATSLLVCELLPPICEHGERLLLLKELCVMALALITEDRKSNAPFEFIMQFLSFYGTPVERIAQQSLESGSSPQRLPPVGKEIGSLLENIILTAVTTHSQNLGNDWVRPREQGEGQSALECKPSPVRKPDTLPNDSLAFILPLIQRCVETCPLFLLHLPAGRGCQCENDLLLRRAVEVSAASLNDLNADVLTACLNFLVAVAKQTNTSSEQFRTFVSDALSRIRGVAIHSLLMGSCSNLYEGHQTITTAAVLLALLLHSSSETEAEAHIVSSLQQDYFCLGDPAKNLTVAILHRCVINQLSPSDLARFLEAICCLHQVEETSALPGSDAVAGFLRAFGS